MADEALLNDPDSLARLDRVCGYALRVFGDPDKALSWLSKPKRRFAGQIPILMLQSESGERLVEEMLAQIDHGMFA